jgi:hypothetical protein
MKSLLASAAFVATVALTAHASADEPTPAAPPAPAAPAAPAAPEGAKAGAQTSVEQAQKAVAPASQKAEEKKDAEESGEKKEPEDTHIHDLTVLLKVGAATTGDRTQDSGPATGGFAGGIDAIYAWKSLRLGGSFLRMGGSNAVYGGSLLAGAGIRQDHVLLRFLLEGGVHGYSVEIPGQSSHGGGTVGFLGGRLDLAYEFSDNNAKVRPEVGIGLVMQEDLSTKHVKYTTTSFDRFTQTTQVSNNMLRVGGSSAAVFLNFGAKFDL